MDLNSPKINKNKPKIDQNLIKNRHFDIFEALFDNLSLVLDALKKPYFY